MSTNIKGSDISNTTPSYLLQFDGLSEPNPGASSGGAVLFDPEGKVVFEAGEFIPFATNNQAEYSGLILGLQTLLAHAPYAGANLSIEGDSMLIINQVAAKWKVKHEALKALHATVHAALANPAFVNVTIKHVYRDKNKYADKLTNDVMKTRTSFLHHP
jgi:ribonuclease HI